MDLFKIAKEARVIKTEHSFDIVEEKHWELQEGVYLIGTKISGIQAEITEMFEALENQDKNNFGEEGIDVILQVIELLYPFVSEIKFTDAFTESLKMSYPDLNFKETFVVGFLLLEIHRYASRMYEGLRKNNLADFVGNGVCILERVATLLNGFGFMIEEEIKKKMEYGYIN